MDVFTASALQIERWFDTSIRDLCELGPPPPEAVLIDLMTNADFWRAGPLLVFTPRKGEFGPSNQPKIFGTGHNT